jgi:hypothetical protein
LFPRQQKILAPNKKAGAAIALPRPSPFCQKASGRMPPGGVQERIILPKAKQTSPAITGYCRFEHRQAQPDPQKNPGIMKRRSRKVFS